MDFSAPAVMDAIAPPPRPEAPTTREADAAHFDEHLESAVRDERKPAAAETENKSSESEPAPEPVAAVAPAPPTQVAPPIVLQFITEPQTPIVSEEAKPDTAKAAPLEADKPAPAPTPAPVTAAPEREAPPLPVASTEDDQGAAQTAPVAQTSDAAPKEAQASEPARQTNAQAPAPQPVATNVVAQTDQVAPETAAPPQTQTAAVAPIATPPAAPQTRPQPTQGKSNTAEGEAKTEGVETPRANGAPQKAQAKARPNAAPAANDAAFKPLETAQQAPAQAPLSIAPQTLAHTQTTVLEHSGVRAAPAVAQVAREIVRRFDGESTRFELRLDPPELGRVEVRLEVSRDHRVTAVVAADSPQALSELARHARELEQTLQSAGLELSDNGLSFDLRQSRDDADEAASGNGRGSDSGETANADAPAVARPIGLERWRGVRVDVMV